MLAPVISSLDKINYPLAVVVVVVLIIANELRVGGCCGGRCRWRSCGCGGGRGGGWLPTGATVTMKGFFCQVGRTTTAFLL